MKSEWDLWYEMWERAGSQGLDIWYDMRGWPEDDPDRLCGPDVDGLDGGLPGSAGGSEGG